MKDETQRSKQPSKLVGRSLDVSSKSKANTMSKLALPLRTAASKPGTSGGRLQRNSVSKMIPAKSFEKTPSNIATLPTVPNSKLREYWFR